MAAEDGSKICKTCRFEKKAKTVDIVLKSFCPGWMKSQRRLQSCWGSKLCHVRHSPHSISSSLLSLSRGLSLPTSFHCSFSWRWSWKVSETCLRHILSLYLIYDLTASKYQSYLNCQRHISMIICKKKNICHDQKPVIQQQISLSSSLGNLQEAAI